MMHRESSSTSSTLGPTATAALSPLRDSSNRLRKTIGGSIGGVSLLALLLFAVWIVVVRNGYSNRKGTTHNRNIRGLPGEATPEGDVVHIEPFLEIETGTYIRSNYHPSADVRIHRSSFFKESNVCST